MNNLGLYIHIPFCVSKCDYCDFLSFGGTAQATKDIYVEALCAELSVLGEQFIDSRIRTVYIGGGTPSVLCEDNFHKLMDAIYSNYTIEPEDVGLSRASISDIQGGANVDEAADQVRSVLKGEAGARLDMVLLNAGASLLAAGKADSLQAGVTQAREIVKSGAAFKKLEQLVSFSSSAA